MSRTTRSSALALAVLALALTACGTKSTESDGTGGSGGSSGPARSSAPSAPGTPSDDGCAADGSAPAELTAADSGRTVCLVVGGQLRLSLDGTTARPWSTVTAGGGDALEAVNAGAVLQPGDAVAAYRAVAAGTASLNASRPLCAQPTAPGQVSCKAVQDWRITVRVLAP